MNSFKTQLILLILIKIDAQTKVIEVKPKAAPKNIAQPPSFEVKKPDMVQNCEPITNEQKYNEEQEKNDTKQQKKHYCAKVQSMIEQFNGRLIED